MFYMYNSFKIFVSETEPPVKKEANFKFHCAHVTAYFIAFWLLYFQYDL